MPYRLKKTIRGDFIEEIQIMDYNSASNYGTTQDDIEEIDTFSIGSEGAPQPEAGMMESGRLKCLKEETEKS